MEMKILHTSDWHLGKIFYGRSMIEDQAYFINEIFYQTLIKEKPDLVILAGDIFDRQIAPLEAISLFNEVILKLGDELKIPFVVISGNHDGAGRITLGAELLREKNIYIASSLSDFEHPILIEKKSEKVQIFTLPYFAPAMVRNQKRDETIRGFYESYRVVLEGIKEKFDSNSLHILVAHCHVMGCAISDSEGTLFIGGSEEISASLFEEFDYVALGHLHTAQKAGKNGRYSGSPLSYSFDEKSNQKSMTIFETADRQILLRTIDIDPLHRVRTIRGSFQDVVEMGKRNPSQDYICVCLTDDVPIYMPMEQLRVYFPNIMTLQSEWFFRNKEKDLDKEDLKEHLRIRNMDDKSIFSSFLKDICLLEMKESDSEIFNQIQEILLKEEKI